MKPNPPALSFSLVRVFLDQRSTWRLLIFTVFGYAFSLAVILSTLGLMDGFSATLLAGLRKSAGDALVTPRQGFADVTASLAEEFTFAGASALAPVVQTEAFLVADDKAQGVLVRGVDPVELKRATGLDLQLAPGTLVIGDALWREWGLAAGQSVALILTKGGEGSGSHLASFQLGPPVKHNIHEKDARYVYVLRTELQEHLGLEQRVNLFLVALAPASASIRAVEAKLGRLREHLGRDWNVRASWQEFSTLLEAVEVEKTSIAIILQLIVVVAVFNIAAFLITLQSRKVREFFLLNALGMPRRVFVHFAAKLMVGLWATSCVLAMGLVKVFNLLLAHAPWLAVPGDIYVLTRLQVLLAPADYLVVFGLALLWMLILGAIALYKMKRTGLLRGLRQEFQ